MNREELYKKCFDKWGKTAQLRVLSEECLELALAITHYLDRHREFSFENMIEEIADVNLMIDQMKWLFKKYNIESISDMKAERTRIKLKGTQKGG